jgi:hypothetical protein
LITLLISDGESKNGVSPVAPTALSNGYVFNSPADLELAKALLCLLGRGCLVDATQICRHLLASLP